MRARSGSARVSAESAGSKGGLYISGPLTPYDVEALYDQLARDEDVRVVVDLGGAPRNSPELRGLARRLKRLERGGLAVSMHAARGKLTPRR